MKTLKLKPGSISSAVPGINSVLPVPSPVPPSPAPVGPTTSLPGLKVTTSSGLVEQNASQSQMIGALTGLQGINVTPPGTSPGGFGGLKFKLPTGVIPQSPPTDGGAGWKSPHSPKGLSDSTATIIAVTDFLPLYDVVSKHVSWSAAHDDPQLFAASLTPAGLLVELAHQSRLVRNIALEKMIESLSKAGGFESLVTNLIGKNKLTMSAARAFVTFITNVLQQIASARRTLDIRSLTLFTGKESSSATESFMSAISNTLIGDGGVAYAAEVLGEYGFSPTKVRGGWSSSRVWLQLANELKTSLKSHSPALLRSSTAERFSDKNSFLIAPSSYEKMEYSSTVLNAKFTVTELLGGDFLSSNSFVGGVVEVDESKFQAMIDRFIAVLNDQYTGNVPQSVDARIAGAIHTAIREIRLCCAVANEELRTELPSISSGIVNASFIDEIIGNVPGSVFDVLKQQENDASRSMVSFAGSSDDNVGEATLRFESGYVDLDDSTITPGAVYYFDEIFNFSSSDGFNVDRLETAIADTVKLRKRLQLLCRAVRISDDLSNSATDAAIAEVLGISKGDVSRSLSTRATFDSLVGSFIDLSNYYNLPVCTNDPASVVLTACVGRPKLMALTFAAFVFSGMRQYAVNNDSGVNGTLVSILVDKMLQELSSSCQLVQGTSSSQSNVSSVTETAIRKVFTEGSNWFTTICNKFCTRFIISMGKLTDVVYEDIGSIETSSDLVGNDHIYQSIDTGKLLNSGINTFSYALLGFDMLCTMLSRFSGLSIIGKQQNTTNVVSYKVSRSFASRSLQYKAIKTALETEERLVERTAKLVINITKKLENSFTNVEELITNPSAASSYTYIKTIINDPDELRLLFTEQQMSNIASVVDDMVATSTNSASIESGYASIGSSEISLQTLSILQAAMQLPEFSTRKALNKRIITVGLPSGMLESLRRRIDGTKKSVSSSSFDRERDIIRINVHRIDLRRPTLVFKPISYLFEMSRYPVRVGSMYSEATSSPTSLDDITSLMMCRDYSDGNGNVLKGFNGSFAAESYSFLPNTGRKAIARNHTLSFMCELYMKLLTGLDLSEVAFLHRQEKLSENVGDTALLSQLLGQLSSTVTSQIVQPTPVSNQGVGGQQIIATLKPSLITSIVQSNSGNGTTSNGKAASKPTSAQQQSASSLKPAAAINGAKSLNNLGVGFGVLAGLTNGLSTVSSPASLATRMLSPRFFDRVLHIIVDSDDFDVDVPLTTSTATGQKAINNQLNSGTIVQTQSISSLQTQPGTEQTVTKAITNDDELVLEQYFVTVETYDRNEQ